MNNADAIPKRDVRYLAQELLKRPEEPLKVPERSQLRAFAKQVDGAIGPQIDPFILDLGSKGLASAWNTKAISLFTEEFLKRNEFPCKDPARISTAFKTHLITLKTHYDDQVIASTMDERRRIEGLDKLKRGALYQRRMTVSFLLILS